MRAGSRLGVGEDDGLVLGFEGVDAVENPDVVAAPRDGVGVGVGVGAPITDTEPDWLLVMDAVFPSGVIATPRGPVPTVMVLVTVPVAVSITDTESALVLATYTALPS